VHLLRAVPCRFDALARIGIIRIKLIDFDTVEFVNLDRLLHATSVDAQLRRSKVNTLARALRKGATADGFRVDEVEKSVEEEDGFRAALDCDVLFSCVDRPWGRSVLNFVASAHLIPAIDGGIQVEANERGGLRQADWKAHIASPERRCLECLGQYDPGLVRLASHKLHLHQVQDLASRYKFTPWVGDRVGGGTVALRLEQLFLRHGPPLVLKRDNGSNLNHAAVSNIQDYAPDEVGSEPPREQHHEHWEPLP
jgi:hypothetical protein